MGHGAWDTDEFSQVAQDPFRDDLDQSPEFDPAEAEPIPEEHFDQSSGT